MGQSLPWFNPNSAIIDLGCGPLTFGLALQAHQLRQGLEWGGCNTLGLTGPSP